MVVAIANPNLLPALAKAGVVDAGGKGLIVILEGMMQVIGGGKIIESTDAVKPSTPAAAAAAANGTSEEITFAYCTEFIVNKKSNAKDATALRAFLETIGDCVVVVDDDDIIKVHVHSTHPGKAIEEGLKFGELTKMKKKERAKLRQEAGITTVVFDRNGYLYHGRVKEVADAARNGGLKF